MKPKNKGNTWTIVAAGCVLLEAWALYVVGVSPARWRPALVVRNEPAAQALYAAMIEAIDNAQSLSYVSVCSRPDDIRICTHKISLKKPDGLCLEATNSPSAKCATLTTDGTSLWIHWSGDRPSLRVDDANSYDEERSNVYMRIALTANDSIQSEIARLGLAWFPPILDPGVFHTGREPLEACRDGVRSRGTDRIGDEEYDVIEVSFMRAQRTRHYWLSRQDRLPRRIKEIVRTKEIEVTVEEWSDVTINGEIPRKALAWRPPEGWRQWDPPDPADSLLPPGQQAPDFDLSGAQRDTIRLSDFRGKVVWLIVWEVGSPPCRRAMQSLAQLHERCSHKGLALLGFNCADDRRIARDFLRETSIAFPSVLDSSLDAEMVMRKGYGNRLQQVPLNYIIDREGKVVDAWYGDEEGQARALAAMKKAGLNVEE